MKKATLSIDQFTSVEEILALVPEPIHPAAQAQPLWPLAKLFAAAAELQRIGVPPSPIQLLKGKILDGRHRRMLCLIAGFKAVFKTIRLPKGMTPEEFVVVNNDLRRHLSKDQLAAMAALAYVDLRQEGIARRIKNLKGAPPEMEKIPLRCAGNSLTHLSALYGVNCRYIQQATFILELEPQLFDEMKQGKTTLKDARLALGLTLREPKKTEPAKLASVAGGPGDTEILREPEKTNLTQLDSPGPKVTGILSELISEALALENLKGAKLRSVAQKVVALAQRAQVETVGCPRSRQSRPRTG